RLARSERSREGGSGSLHHPLRAALPPRQLSQALKLTALLFLVATPGLAASESPDFHKAAISARQTLQGMVAADTTTPPGNEAKVAELVAARLKAEGIPYTLTEFAPGRKNIVARLKASYSSKLKPVLILAHEDVVGAASQKWAFDAHAVTERDGYLY